MLTRQVSAPGGSLCGLIEGENLAALAYVGLGDWGGRPRSTCLWGLCVHMGPRWSLLACMLEFQKSVSKWVRWLLQSCACMPCLKPRNGAAQVGACL